MEEAKPRSPRASGAVPTQPRGIEQIIKAAVDRGASDLHIKAGDVFRARIDGKLVPLTKQRLTPEQTRAIAPRPPPRDEDRGGGAGRTPPAEIGKAQGRTPSTGKTSMPASSFKKKKKTHDQ